MHRRSRIHASRTKKRPVLAVILLLVLLVGAFFVIKAFKFLPVAYDVAFKKEITLKKTPENRVNILLLGIGGGKHDGPNLTDTIIFASIDPETKKVTMISIPRDLWVPELHAKINTAYAYGEEKKIGGGLTLAKATISKILGQPIDYGVRVDFAGFVKAVDMVGGIDVVVDRTLDDPEYPISGKEEDTCGFTGEEFEKRATDTAQLEAFPCRYEHLHFDPGEKHMDGETALRFVRSRHAIGPEGTDFARSKRQEKVILALKEKVFSAGTLLNPVKIVNLVTILKDSIDTDITEDEYGDFINLAEKVRSGKMKSAVIDYGDTEEKRYGLLINPPITEEFRNQWVLSPRIGNGQYSEIQRYVACMIKTGTCEVGKTGILTPTPVLSIPPQQK